jgi:hypothetical protein
MSWLYLSNPCAFSYLIAHGAAGAVSARLSLRPFLTKRDNEIAELGQKHVAGTYSAVIARLDRAIQYSRDGSD